MYHINIEAEVTTQLGYLLYSIEGVDVSRLLSHLIRISRVDILGCFRHINSEKLDKVK